MQLLSKGKSLFVSTVKQLEAVWHTISKCSKRLDSNILGVLSSGLKRRQHTAGLGLSTAEYLWCSVFGATIAGIRHNLSPTNDRFVCLRELSALECTTGLFKNLYDDYSGDLRLVWIRGQLWVQYEPVLYQALCNCIISFNVE